MSHEIRSPLAGVVSIAKILSTSKLDKEQRQLLSVMLSSGDLVLQLINDILYLSKVESGVMRLEATKFRPREVVKHVLQIAAASLQKTLTLEGHITNDVPVEISKTKVISESLIALEGTDLIIEEAFCLFLLGQVHFLCSFYYM